MPIRFAPGRNTLVRSSKAVKTHTNESSSKNNFQDKYRKKSDPDTIPDIDSRRFQCPLCRNDIVADVRYEPTAKTHIWAALLCILFFPCVWLPYACEGCKSANHYCPSCGEYIGTYDE